MKNAAKLFLPAISLVFMATGPGLHAQSSARSSSRAVAASTSPTKHKTIRARAGESLSSVAERTGVSADELARLNNLSTKAKLKKGQRLLIPSGDAAQAQGGPENQGLPNGMLIKFVDGGTLHVESAWWKGEDVWYTRRDGVTEIASRKVKAIEPVFVASVKPNKTENPPPVKTAGKATETVSTWIYLVGGARMKVDHVDKRSDGAWYQRGNLLSFLENARIERIERELPGAHPAAWQDQGWSSGNPGIDQLIRANGTRFGVDPYLVFLVIEQESHFRTRALSPKGAQGLMQLMPGTARRFGVRRPYDPVENIRGGTQYLKELLTMFRGRVDLALASYNAGEHRVISYGNKVPPFQETQNYVRRINQRYKKGAGSKTGGAKASTSGIRPALTENNP